MKDRRRESMLLIASESEFRAGTRVWGDGGWAEPEDREALDWLTLARITGWSVGTARNTEWGLDGGLSRGNRWIVIASEPDHLREEIVSGIFLRLESEPLLVVARAGCVHSALARLSGVSRQRVRSAGKQLRWIGPGSPRDWTCRKPIPFTHLKLSPSSSVWATLDGAPVVAVRRMGTGAIVTLGFHPSVARDADGAATALLRHLLICGATSPVAWLDWEGTLVLRMDDPGGAENVFSRTWCYPKLSAGQWTAIGQGLRRRNARLSILYVAGWVDDGDPNRGTLILNGERVARVPGNIYPSPLVQYVDHAGHTPGTYHDYTSEFAGIQALRAAGLAEVELHGYTHMHPNTHAWAKAPDRYEAKRWYRELGHRRSLARRSRDDHPLALGLAAFRHFFNVRPTTLVSPGDHWTNETLECALDLGIQLADSYYLAIRHNERFCWCTHVCSPYLNEPDSGWFDSGLPVVGYFHDLEPAVEGVDWFVNWLDRWQTAGARRFIDFRELAAAVGRCLYLDDDNGCLRLEMNTFDDTPDLVRPLPIRLYSQNNAPPRIRVSVGDNDFTLLVHSRSDGSGQITIPTGALKSAPLKGQA